jgi:hypothetical protein
MSATANGSTAVQERGTARTQNGSRFRRLVSRNALDKAVEPEPLAPDIGYLEYGPEIVAALLNGEVGFQEIALAYLFGRPQTGEQAAPGRVVSEENRAVLRQQFPTLMRRYLQEHGCLTRCYFARNCFAAAALTGEDEIELILAGYLPEPEAVEVLRRAQGLGYSAYHRLEEYDRRLCQRMVFSVIHEVLRRLDNAAATCTPVAPRWTLTPLTSRVKKSRPCSGPTRPAPS